MARSKGPSLSDLLRKQLAVGEALWLDGLRLAAEYREGAAIEDALELRDLPPDRSPHDLSQTGWGVIFGPRAADEAEDALRPLLDRRREQAGGRPLYFEHVLCEKRTEHRGRDYLWRELSDSPGVIDLKALPYYVLLVGGPEEIPFHFQADLAVNRAVGRLHFTQSETARLHYASYAQSVLEAEDGYGTAAKDAFLVEIETDKVICDIGNALRQGVFGPLARMSDWQTVYHRSKSMGHQDLLDILSGPTPGLLAIIAHGKRGIPGDGLQPQQAGAILLSRQQDLDRAAASKYFDADDIEKRWPNCVERPFQGMAVALFCCYSLGVPQFDEYPLRDDNPSNTWQKAEPDFIATQPLLSRLPQALLARGTLAVLGHVERAFTSSFLWRYGGQESFATRSLLTSLQQMFEGHRLGHALRPLFRRYAYIAAHLLPMIEAVRNGWHIEDEVLQDQWVAYVDARNYMLLGDPAVYATGQSCAENFWQEGSLPERSYPASAIYLDEALIGRIRRDVDSDQLQLWVTTALEEALARNRDPRHS